MPYLINDDDGDEEASEELASERARLRQVRLERQELLELFDSPLGQRVLARLELRFEINLPAFQGKLGHYDALDAMRRDAHREVFLLIQHQLVLAKQEATQHKNNV